MGENRKLINRRREMIKDMIEIGQTFLTAVQSFEVFTYMYIGPVQGGNNACFVQRVPISRTISKLTQCSNGRNAKNER